MSVAARVSQEMGVKLGHEVWAMAAWCLTLLELIIKKLFLFTESNSYYA